MALFIFVEFIHAEKMCRTYHEHDVHQRTKQANIPVRIRVCYNVTHFVLYDAFRIFSCLLIVCRPPAYLLTNRAYAYVYATYTIFPIVQWLGKVVIVKPGPL